MLFLIQRGNAINRRLDTTERPHRDWSIYLWVNFGTKVGMFFFIREIFLFLNEMAKLKCGILGATGMVGQRFIQLLEHNDRFEVFMLGASERSAGKKYSEACNWKLSTDIPRKCAEMLVYQCDPSLFAGCDVIFSGLDSSVAGQVESAFRLAEFAVFSNAKNYRMDPLCPLVVPMVNPEHLELVKWQREKLSLKSGFIYKKFCFREVI